jgi:hypothetical protein
MTEVGRDGNDTGGPDGIAAIRLGWIGACWLGWIAH